MNKFYFINNLKTIFIMLIKINIIYILSFIIKIKKLNIKKKIFKILLIFNFIYYFKLSKFLLNKIFNFIKNQNQN